MQFDQLRRREVLALFGGAAAAWPLLARAQQPAMPVIGYLSARSPEDTAHLVEAFRRGLGETGFFEGHNVTIEYRWALGHQDRLPALAADLVQKPVTVLVSTGGESAALAALAASYRRAGRKCHRNKYPDRHFGTQAARIVARADAARLYDRRPLGPELPAL